MECIFCDIVMDTKKAHMIYENDYCMAFLDRYPIDYGHSLVIPKHHYEKITDMDIDEVGKLFACAPMIAKGIMSATGAVAFSLGQNNGSEAGQIIGHVHVHIIPRYMRTSTNWTKRGIIKDSQLAHIASDIRSHM